MCLDTCICAPPDSTPAGGIVLRGRGTFKKWDVAWRVGHCGEGGLEGDGLDRF